MREEFTNMRDLEGEGGRYFLSKDKDIISVSHKPKFNSVAACNLLLDKDSDFAEGGIKDQEMYHDFTNLDGSLHIPDLTIGYEPHDQPFEGIYIKSDSITIPNRYIGKEGSLIEINTQGGDVVLGSAIQSDQIVSDDGIEEGLNIYLHKAKVSFPDWDKFLEVDNYLDNTTEPCKDSTYGISSDNSCQICHRRAVKARNQEGDRIARYCNEGIFFLSSSHTEAGSQANFSVSFPEGVTNKPWIPADPTTYEQQKASLETEHDIHSFEEYEFYIQLLQGGPEVFYNNQDELAYVPFISLYQECEPIIQEEVMTSGQDFQWIDVPSDDPNWGRGLYLDGTFKGFDFKIYNNEGVEVQSGDPYEVSLEGFFVKSNEESDGTFRIEIEYICNEDIMNHPTELTDVWFQRGGPHQGTALNETITWSVNHQNNSIDFVNSVTTNPLNYNIKIWYGDYGRTDNTSDLRDNCDDMNPNTAYDLCLETCKVEPASQYPHSQYWLQSCWDNNLRSDSSFDCKCGGLDKNNLSIPCGWKALMNA